MYWYPLYILRIHLCIPNNSSATLLLLIEMLLSVVCNRSATPTKTGAFFDDGKRIPPEYSGLEAVSPHYLLGSIGKQGARRRA